jgi:tight adherence protein C
VNVAELLALCALAAGSALVLSELPWFRHRALSERLRPYRVGSAPRRGSPSASWLESMQQVLLPVVTELGARLGRLLGVDADLATRLARAGDPTDPATFRLRQAAAAGAGLAGSVLVVVWRSPPWPVVAALLLGGPVLGALAVEQRLSSAVDERQRRRRAELPVVVEQLGLLLGAGYSLTSALARLSARGSGAIAGDLRTVTQRVRHGVTEAHALEEWARVTGLDTVARLVAVLALHSEAGDLATLVAEEARAERAAAHRDLLEVIERRSQLVWVPVTVATLVPGLIFLAVPFTSAMSKVTGGG